MGVLEKVLMLIIRLSWLIQNVFKIGDYSNIGYGARIDCIRRQNDKEYNPSLEIGNGVSIGQNCTISCTDKIIIGDNVVISFGSFISDNEHQDLPLGIPLFEKGIRVAHVTIGENTFVGCNSIVLEGVSVGKNCIIGAGSLIKKDVPDNTMVAGVPAKVIKIYNKKTKKWDKVSSK